MGNFKEMMELTLKHNAKIIVRELLKPNPWLDAYMAERKSEWDALPWYKKLSQRINNKISTVTYRMRRAWAALCGVED